jgi:lipopolysaccharide export LptBFGC system permease protein LptF
MSGLEFETYSLALSDLSGSQSAASVTPNTAALLRQLSAGELSERDNVDLHSRNASALYILSMGLLAFFMVSRPNTMRGKSRISVDFVVLTIAVIVKVTGTGAEQFIFRSPALWPLIYAPPILPILLALPMIIRQGLFSNFSSLRGAA